METGLNKLVLALFLVVVDGHWFWLTVIAWFARDGQIREVNGDGVSRPVRIGRRHAQVFWGEQHICICICICKIWY